MVKPQIRYILIIGLGAFILVSPLYSQYSKWEIEAAIEYLKKHQILDNLIKLTQEDPAKLASRPDVLIACYEIIRELEKMEKTLNHKITRLKSLAQSFEEDTLKTENNSERIEQILIDRVIAEVESNLDNFSNIINFKKDLELLNIRVDSLFKQIEYLSTQIIKEDDKKSHKNKK
jgi:hypothetical protein